MPPPGQAQRAAQKYIVFEQFEKMNTQSVRQALSEKELSWLENLQPIAPNNLVTVAAPAVSSTSITGTIYKQFFANLGPADYIISFTTDGAAWYYNIGSSAAPSRFASPGTFSNPDMTVWQSQYVLFNDPTAGYSAWAGPTTNVFVRQGGVSPILILTAPGSGFTSPPTVTISGGSGTGATAIATLGTPGVIAVNVVTPGSGYSSAPAVGFSGGGGSGAAATAVIDTESVTSVTLTNSGLYTSGGTPTASVAFGGPGTGAAANATMVPIGGGQWRVNSITLTAGGTGYTSAPSITITTTAVTNVTATATCTVGAGGVISVNVTVHGSGYTSAPTVALTGGGGSGATATSVIGGSGVLSIVLTNPGSGYLASDVLTLTISGGGGTGATGTAHVWPFVTAGTTLAVFAGRVWLAGGRLLQWSGTQGFDDFNIANASGALTIGDADLQHAITALRNYNNYLFIMGDQSVKQIGSISVSGSATLFTILTLSSDQGTIYPLSCGSYNRVFMFANTNGVYAVLGSSVQKISDDMDGIFKLVDFTQRPQAAIVDMNNIHNIAWLVRYVDPLTVERSIMLIFNGKKWFVANQGNSVVTIVATSTLASGKITTYSSSGSDITAMFQSPTVPVTFKIQTALTHHGNAVQRKKVSHMALAVTGPAGGGSLGVSIDTDNGSQGYTPAVVAGFQFIGFGADGSGEYLGATVTGTMAGFTFTNTAQDYQEISRPFAK